MLTYPNIDPVAFHIGTWPVYWYGIIYLVSFVAAWGLLSLRLRTVGKQFTKNELSDILFYGALGVIIGGRIGYVFFYDWNFFIANPLFIFQTWKGGMSFHGGLLGVMIAIIIFSWRHKKAFFDVTDFIIPVVPIGLGLGRIGNFINGELSGRVTQSSWGMVFPNAGDLPRYPSQLFEAFFEGLVLFIILWFFSRKPRARGAVSGLFLVLYGIFRFGIEFFREPDLQKGFIALGWMTEGQRLSLPMIGFGIAIIIWAYYHESIFRFFALHTRCGRKEN